MSIYNHLPAIVLASTSKHRATLLNRLRIPFKIISPRCTEDAIPGEIAELKAARLSKKKALSVRNECNNCIIIGSDQVAILSHINDESGHLHKTKNYQSAYKQLQRISGKTVYYHSGLYVLDTRDNQEYERVVQTCVKYRNFTDKQIHEYIEDDQPFDCASSVRTDTLGISLIEEMSCEDNTAITGLPLIQLTNILISIPGAHTPETP